MLASLLRGGRVWLVLALLPGCARMNTPRTETPWNAEAAQAADAAVREQVFRAKAVEADRETPQADAAPSGTTYTLEALLALAQTRHPTLREFAASRSAAQAEALRALAYPNPELEATIGLASTLDAPVETATEFGLGLLQTLEWPAKRRSRREAAEALGPIVEREEDVFRTQLRADVSRAYYSVLYYQRARQLAQVTADAEARMVEIVQRRVEHGEAPPVDLIKARVEALRARRIVQARGRELAAARTMLNSLTGRSLEAGFALSDELEQALPDVSEAQATSAALKLHPTLRRLEAVAWQRALAVGEQRKAWYPDLTLGVRGAREMDVRKTGLSAGFPLPLWNRNAGGIAAAQAELDRAGAELQREQQAVLRDVETALQRYENAREQAQVLAGELRKAAGEALRIVTFQYEEGEAELLQVIDARRTASLTEHEALQALHEAQIARVELEATLGIGGLQ